MDAPIAQQPLFYLLIAASVLLTLGYGWGQRRNKRIYLNALNALVHTLKPRDQQFTNIGGYAGYHANLIPKRPQPIRRVDATITLLARPALLYFPISRLTRKWDRLFITLVFTEQAQGKLAEGHLIERRYEAFRAPKITNAARLQHERLAWGGGEFTLYFETEAVRSALLRLQRSLGQPGELRHVALLPAQAHLFLVPRIGETGRVFPVVYGWLGKLLVNLR